MPSTTNFAIPYPQASDTVDVPRDIQAVADQLELKLDSLRYQSSHRNRIINGDFSVNQRAFSSTTTTATYGFDRWFGQWSGGTVTYSSQAFTLGNPITGQEPTNHARLVTASHSLAAHYARLEQRIESVRTFAGQTVTLSFWAKAGSGTPKIAIELQQYFGTGGSPSTQVNTYAGQATLSTSWTRYTLTVAIPSVSGKTIGTNANDFLGLDFYTSAGSDYNSRTGSLGVQNITVDLWGVQLEAGAYATPFEHRPRQVELALCQRYYQETRGETSSGTILGYGYADGIGTAYYATFPLIVEMRAAPTIGVLGTPFGFDIAVQRTVTSVTSTRSTTKIACGDPTYTGGTFNASRSVWFIGAGHGFSFSSEL